MGKYWAYFRINAQNGLTYSGPIIIYVLSGMFRMSVMVAVWISSSSGEMLGGYTKPELVTYYVVALLIDRVIFFLPYYGLVQNIANGKIVGDILLKPISAYWRNFFLDFSWHLISFLLGTIGCFILIFFLKDYLILSFSNQNLLPTLAAIVLAIFINYTFSFCMGLIAFWTTHTSSMDAMYWMALSLLGGYGLPVSFLPETIRGLIYLLPFRYMFSFPLEIYFGKLSPYEIMWGFAVGIYWLLIFLFLYRWMWKCGRKAYASFGQ